MSFVEEHRRPEPLSVAVVMGSRSDLPALAPAVETLGDFDVEHEIRFLSAHRTPREALAFAEGAVDRRIGAIIAGAGGAAHLPGMLASVTSVPVIGVPIAVTAMVGVDSLLSMVQTPPGVPVATVAVDSAVNAALLAIRVLSVSNPFLQSALDAHRRRLWDEVEAFAEPENQQQAIPKDDDERQ